MNWGKRKNQGNRKLFRSIILFLLALLLLCLAAGILLLRRRMPAKAVKLVPDGEITCENPVFYRQNDPEWGEEPMGASRDTMKRSGCLVTCIAASLEMQTQREDAQFHLTPGELNRQLTAQGVYDDNGNILWQPLREFLPEWEIETPEKVKAEVVETLLAEGFYPIVKVKMPVSGANHWVLLLEARGGTYYCMDPLNGDGEPVPLSNFHDEVYALRYLRLRH